MRIPSDIQCSAKCAMCCGEAIMECVECLRELSASDDAPSFCSAGCLKKHFGQHRTRAFGSKRSSSSSGSSSSISSGSSSPSLSGSEPSSPQSPAPVLVSRGPHWQQHSPAHHYVQQYVHMQPPPPRSYAPVMHGHRHAIEVGGPAPHWQQHHRRR